MFCMRHVRYSTESSGDQDDVATWWRLFGVEAYMLDIFVLIDPRWDGVNLVVSAAVEPAGLNHIVVALEYLFTFQTYVSTRWCGIGPSSRLYMRSVSCGLTPLVLACEADGVDMTYLHGHTKASGDIRRFIAIAAIGSFPAERFCGNFLKMIAFSCVRWRCAELCMTSYSTS